MLAFFFSIAGLLIGFFLPPPKATNAGDIRKPSEVRMTEKGGKKPLQPPFMINFELKHVLQKKLHGVVILGDRGILYSSKSCRKEAGVCVALSTDILFCGSMGVGETR